MEITGVTVNLGNGSDRLTLSLSATGPGANAVVVAGNTFDGGRGTDRLTLGDGSAGNPAAIVDVQGGTLQIGGTGSSTLRGFEVFQGGSGDDRFIDGTGAQSYAGGGGADTFVFVAGRPGADTVTGFAADDVVRLRNFGPALDSFADVLVAATDTAQGVLIDTGTGLTVLLAGVLEASLVADDFVF